MITLGLKDFYHKKLYVLRYGGKEIYKTNNRNTLKRLERAMKVLGVKQYHIYSITIEKEVKNV